MSQGRKIKAQNIVADIRHKLSDFELLTKYDLSPEELTGILERLVEAGGLRLAEVTERGQYLNDPFQISRTRCHPREYLRIPLSVVDASSPNLEGLVVDLSERGFRTRGVAAGIGDIRVFHLMVTETDAGESVLVQAVCRWTKMGHTDRMLDQAGFEIIGISDEGLAAIRKLMNRLGLGDVNLKQTISSVPK